jgi:RNA polymerase sigma-70 factor (ECF subfamily)
MNREELDALVARAQEGDLRAFEALAVEFSPQVRRFARAFAGSDADADDLAQDALLRVYRNLRRFTYQSAFSTWLYAVVRNVFLDAARGRAGTARRTEEPLADGHADREGGARPDEDLEREQARRQVWNALQQVPAEYRTALVLFDIEGCTYDEVAAVEGVPVGTVKSRLHRGRAHLRTLLEAAGEPAGTSGEVAPSYMKRRP